MIVTGISSQHQVSSRTSSPSTTTWKPSRIWSQRLVFFGNVELGFYANFSLYAQLFQDDSTEKLFQLEPNAPSTLVTCIFASCYFSLGNQFYRDESIKVFSIIQSLNGKILQLNSNYRNRKKNFSCCNALKFCILFSSTFRRQKGFFNLSFTSSDSE